MKSSDSEVLNIAVLLACHNRRAKTLECLRHLAGQKLPDVVRCVVTLVDDGSTDGTFEAVRAEFPDTTMIRGDGNLFWCGGMRVAWTAAAVADPDYYLLANDDTLLDEDALSRLLEISGRPDARIIAVAAIRDPLTGAHTYGGVRGANDRIPVTGRLEACDTFNANAVLIPRAVYRELGIFHPTYTHAMGDFDYGYAATRQGIKVIQSAESLGTCGRNTSAGTWKDTSLSRRDRLKKLQSPKGLPWKEWVVYNRRNAGLVWPWRCISPILRILCGR
jgi:GT2 family glycosyltransferase